MDARNVKIRRFRPLSAKSDSLQRKITTGQLQDLALDPQRMSSFASSSNLRSKSAKLYKEESQDLKKETKKQAWAPKPKQILTTSSTNFQEQMEPSLQRGNISRHHEEKAFGRAEDHIFLNDLKLLREKFEEADKEGNGTIAMDEFLLTFDKIFDLDGKNEQEIITFFNKIDYKCDGYIDWDEFCTYMYLEFQERDDIINNSKKVDFVLPAEALKQNPHKDSVCRVSRVTDGGMVTCSLDGVMCFWTHDYKPKRIRKSEIGLTGKPKWITDMALCIPQSKILLTTGDSEIQFYEIATFEPHCQLKKLDAVPLRVDFWSNPEKNDDCVILIGDNEGTVTVIKTTNIQEAFKHWKHGTKTEDGMPTYPVDKLITDRIDGTNIYRWKLHSNWVSEVCYIPSLHNFASCSCDPVNSLVLGSPSGSTPVEALLQAPWHLTIGEKSEEGLQEMTYVPRPKTALVAKNRFIGDQRIFRLSKGISTFDYCSKNNCLVTGGLDQLVRIWNPFINNKPIACLYGHDSPVFSVQVDSEKKRIYSVGNDSTVKVWGMLDHSCHATVIPSAHKLTAEVEYFYFNPHHSLLVMTADQVTLLRMMSSKGVRMDIVQSHLQPITAVKYSHCFNQVVTCCQGSLVKVWDISTGKSVFEFSAIMEEGVGISAMDVDKAGKRIATGGENGEIKIWNYNNGHCVRMLDKGNSMETSDIKFITLNDNKYIICVGWDRKIHLFPDIPARHVQQLLKPIDSWSRASSRGHSEDILCIAVGSPNLMATSSFDGEIIVWSVVSCHMLVKLRIPHSTPTSAGTTSSKHAMDEERAVHKILFLEKRSHLTKTAATLVSSGPSGKVHFWNVYEGSSPMGAFKASRSLCISDMTVDDTNSVLITADTQGYVFMFNIKNYCIRGRASDPPKRILIWRAHTQRISSLKLVDHKNALVTGSVDGAVRLWTLEGQYIGTFGQDQKWKLGDPSTYQHPLAPKDVLMDQDSLPSTITKVHTTISPAEVEDVKTGMVGLEYKEREELSDTSEDDMSVTDIGNDEEEQLLKSHISLQIPSYKSPQVGKRLRHLRTHSAIRKDDTRSRAVYGHLPCYPLNDESIMNKIQPPSDLQRPKTIMGVFGRM